MNDVRAPDGARSLLKLEGIEPAATPGQFDVVADVDDPQAAALLGLLRVAGL